MNKRPRNCAQAREAGLVLVFGIVVGAALALAGSPEAVSLLYGLKPYDPATLLMAVAALSLIATAASWVPGDASFARGSGGLAEGRVDDRTRKRASLCSSR
jgi:hypothetical protein